MTKHDRQPGEKRPYRSKTLADDRRRAGRAWQSKGMRQSSRMRGSRHGRSGFSASTSVMAGSRAVAGRVGAHDRQVDALERGSLVRHVPGSRDRATNPRVRALGNRPSKRSSAVPRSGLTCGRVRLGVQAHPGHTGRCTRSNALHLVAPSRRVPRSATAHSSSAQHPSTTDAAQADPEAADAGSPAEDHYPQVLTVLGSVANYHVVIKDYGPDMQHLLDLLLMLPRSKDWHNRLAAVVEPGRESWFLSNLAYARDRLCSACRNW
jgi:hypothetical protein